MNKAKSPVALRLAAKTLMRQNTIRMSKKSFYFCALSTLLECTIYPAFSCYNQSGMELDSATCWQQLECQTG